MLVKDYQLDPITHQLLHADFYRVAMDKMLQVTVPVVVKGEPKGVKQQGGILEFVRREIEIECLPADIPEHIDVDVSELMLHQGVRVRDVATDAQVEAGQRRRHDARPRHHAEGRGGRRRRPTRRPRPAAPAEPEVIKKGKKDEDEDEKDDKKKKYGRADARQLSEADRRARQSRARSTRARGTTSGSRWSTSWRGAASAGVRVGAGRGADRASGGGRTASLLAKPLTFMNLSGQAVGELLRYFKIELADLLVVVDEVQLPLGRLRARPRGSAGGHNGLKSIIAHARTTSFARLRIGVGRGDARRDLADHVLARFEPDEAAEVERMTRSARGRCGGDCSSPTGSRR